ncbi:MAG: hypothetical protein M3033_11815 [Acidobacteriota bacterium]|nr:hypothetical protein [Acidobacteriota bacterium]
MKKNSILLCICLTIFIFNFQTASAQFPITIPRIPKIKKPKPEQPTTTTTTPATTTTTASAESRTNENKPETKTSAVTPPEGWMSVVLDDLKKKQKEVDEYTPADKLYLVSQTQDDYLLLAVSRKARDAWWKDHKINDWRQATPGNQIDSALDALDAAAAKKLPTYKGNLTDFKFHNPAEEKMMKGVLKRIADYKIYSAGLSEGSWLIDKNDLGIPTARYKHGAFYLKDTTDDHPYCYLTYVNIIQDYAGGGTYAASYAQFIRDELVGCPATGK